MAHVELRPAQLTDADFIARRVRKADYDELVATTGKHPFFAMMTGLNDCPERTVTAWFNGEPACMWGVSSGGLALGVGVPWMVGTDALDKHSKTFLKRCRKPVMALLDGYDILINYVDARNVRAIGWLKFCGFTVDEAEEIPGTGLMFHKFWMKRG